MKLNRTTPCIIAVFLLMSCSMFCQQKTDAVSSAITKTMFSSYAVNVPAKRKLLSLEKKSVFAKLNPLTYVSAGLLFFYQRVISEQIQADCTYEISCSEYTKLSIQKYGFAKGSLLGIHQLNNCAPGALDDHCKRFISEEQKIINSLDNE